MAIALKEALKSLDSGDVPIGCVITDENGKIIAKAHNRREKDNDATAHAEILAIKKSGRKARPLESYGVHFVCHARAVRHVCGSCGKRAHKPHSFRSERFAFRVLRDGLQSCRRREIQPSLPCGGRRFERRVHPPRQRIFSKAQNVEK